MATEAGAGASDAPFNPLAMSDEEFLKLGIPPEQAQGSEKAEGSGDAGNAGGEDTQPAASSEDPAKDQGGGGDTLAAGQGQDGLKDPTAPADGGKGEAAKDPKEAASAEPPGSPGSSEADKKPKEGEQADQKAGDEPAEQAAPNYEDFYKKVMAPFKANGKTIELKSPDEAISLMQMGANYTRKMQELVPHRKMLTMLQNNNLMDEERISFLIDLDKKNPEAIKKLLKDSGIDPMEIDVATEPAYQAGSHRVTDEEVNFRTHLEELSSNPEGKETLQDINTRWDNTSKELLWKHPETMRMIDEQRKVGIYGRICDEIDRQKVLGRISPQTPFLEAYKIVGDELTAANGFVDLREKHQGTARQDPPAHPGQGGNGTTPAPVATRVAAPKPQVSNDDRASAASSTRSSSKPAKEFVNPLAMSDDEFLKQFAGRL